MKWINIEKQLPEEGKEVLLYNKKWVHEDFNPHGIRIGFLGGEGWISAYYCNCHDEYMTRNSVEDDEEFEDSKAENQIPTHWCPLSTYYNH